jgi:hypothetical protein
MTDCPICYESITQTTGCCVLSCSHSFHIKCLTKWTSDASTCPMCRHALTDIELNRPDPPPKPEITHSQEVWINIGNYTWTSEDRILQVINEAGVTRSRAIQELRYSGGNTDEAILMIRDSHRYIPSTPPPPRNPMEPTDEMLTAWALERLFKYGTIEEGYDYGSLADIVQRNNVTRFSGHACSLWMNQEFEGVEVRDRSHSV